MTDSGLPSIQDIGLEDLSDSVSQPDEETLGWKESAEKEKLGTEITELRQNISQRKTYALRLFILLCVWIGAILLLLFFQGFKFCKFDLGEPVLIAALATTTVNITALFVVVAKYIFPGSP
jgi:hypothetical protein